MSPTLEATVATSWWIDQLRGKVGLTNDEATRVEEALASAIDQALADPPRDGRILVEWDWDPYGILLDVLELTGVDWFHRAPNPGSIRHHRAIIKPGSVHVMAGYAVPLVAIYGGDDR